MQPLNLTVLFEDHLILAVHKPPGIPSHSLSDLKQITVEQTLKKTRPELTEIALLHRLDTGTSGVLLFAKTADVFRLMREKFKHKQIGKYYRAWSRLPLPHVDFPLRIDTPLAHHPKSKKRMIPLPSGKKLSFRGKPLPAESIILSQQHFAILEGEKISEFEVQILTGVTHQIRVHLAFLGAPLIGDPLYNPQTLLLQKSERLGLHAERVEFNLNGKLYQIQAPLTCPYL